MMDREIRVAVFCGGTLQGPKVKEFCEEARELGRALAQGGYICVTGGGGGLMKEVALGVQSGDGRVECIALAGSPPDYHYDGLELHDSLQARQTALLAKADMFVAIRGGIGTLYEITQVLADASMNTRDDRLLICYRWPRLFPLLEELQRDGFLRRPYDQTVYQAYSVEQIIRMLAFRSFAR